MVRQAPVICVMAPPIHLGAWSMALMLWLLFELLLLFLSFLNHPQIKYFSHEYSIIPDKIILQASTAVWNYQSEGDMIVR